ncbi:hypothetical protein PR202_ga28909 [Eleusine coracana subsp. coracana]|uniref:Uncharacterized protein n=1 Tax=Eleusine coracana subsp. coracana TaxID=191504 RepID=A0AAV5DK27_ELECO|nr:hypothetical protein PR202_ga28909 [Eleusine coracana subsp. coracana]
MASSSSLNPNAPLFIPAAYRQVEDYSPEWWELVQTTAWFRDHWVRQHQLHEAHHDAALAALPDDLLDDTQDLFYHHPQHHPHQDADVLRALASPRGAPSPPWDHHHHQQQQMMMMMNKPAAIKEAPARQPR